MLINSFVFVFLDLSKAFDTIHISLFLSYSLNLEYIIDYKV